MPSSPINEGTATGAGTVTTPGSTLDPAALANPYVLVRNASGYFAETLDRKVIAGAQAAVDGSIYFTSIGLLAGQVVSAIAVNIGAPGSGITLSKLGLYDKLGNLLAASADQGSAWAAQQLGEGAMLVPYVVPATDIYYGAAIVKASGLPTFVSVSGATISLTRNGSFPVCALMTGQTDLPPVATYTISPASLLSKVLWMGFR